MLALLAITTILQTQSAPSDVPRGHWAHSAVDTLFREGLLKGYPPEKGSRLALDESITRDFKVAETWVNDWTKKRLLVGHHTCTIHGYRDRSNYELAVAVHAMWAVASEKLKDQLVSSVEKAKYRDELLTIAKGISMFKVELDRLGAESQVMMKVLKELDETPNRQFRG